MLYEQKFEKPACVEPRQAEEDARKLTSLRQATITAIITTAMRFIHAREHLNNCDSIRVECDTQCNIMLTTDSEFANFQRGGGCVYHGGFFRRFPATITPKYPGYWNITLDVGEGYEATVKYSITVIRKQ